MLQGDPQLDRELRAENRNAGRWRRRLFVVVVAMLVAIVGWGILAAVTTPTVEAQSPSPEPPPWFGGRVEMPEHGFAVTVPDGWFAVDLTRDVEEQARTAALVTDPDASEEAIEMATSFVRSLRDRGWQLALADLSAYSTCTILVEPAVGRDLDSWAEQAYDFVSSDERVIHAEPPHVVALPAGVAHLVTYGGEAYERAGYMGEGAGKAFYMDCLGGSRPADDWRAVIETLEWLPSGESPRTWPPPWFGGRVEVPEDGFALTLPEGWAAIDVTGDADRQARALAAALQPFASDEELDARAEAYLGEDTAGERLVLVSTSTADLCSIVVMPPSEADLVSLAERAFAGGLRDRGVTHAESPQVVALPAGEARLVTRDYEDSTELAGYLLQGPEAIVLLGCSGSAQAGDDWRSIAESFEFLPAEE